MHSGIRVFMATPMPWYLANLRSTEPSSGEFYLQRHIAPFESSYSYAPVRSRQDLYLTKKEQVDIKSQRVTVGLEKLKKGAADVETMKVREDQGRYLARCRPLIVSLPGVVAAALGGNRS